MENNEQLAKREAPQSFIERLIENTDSLEKVKEVGMVIINSGFCPQHFKDSKDAVGAIMCIEAGRKLGLSWMQSLSDIYPVKGRIGIMGTAAKAVIFSSGVLESWKEWTEGEYPQKNYKHITESKRKGLPDVFRTEFSVYDAEMAGLMGKDIYKKYGKRMIAWRDIGFHASDYYQDILKGMKTVEELNDFDGFSPDAPSKTIITSESGAEIEVNGGDKKHSGKVTSRVASKIPDNKFGAVKNENIQDAEIIPETPEKKEQQENIEPERKEESPFIPSKGAVEYLDGKEVKRDGEEITGGAPADDELSKKEAKELLKIVNEDMDMMESCEIIGGKNTKQKLLAIIVAFREGRLAEHTAPYIKEAEERQKAFEASQAKDSKSTEPLSNAQTGEINVNKSFDKAPESKETTDLFLSKEPIKKEESKAPETGNVGNKYGIEISEAIPRDFSIVKTLFNRMMGVTPQITTPRYMELVTKIGLQAKFADKETFIKNASVEEINNLLNAN